MAYSIGPTIVTDGLVAVYDPSNPKSWPGSGTTLFDIAGIQQNMDINFASSTSQILGTTVRKYLTPNGGNSTGREISYTPTDSFTVSMWYGFNQTTGEHLLFRSSGQDSSTVGIFNSGSIAPPSENYRYFYNGPRGNRVNLTEVLQLDSAKDDLTPFNITVHFNRATTSENVKLYHDGVLFHTASEGGAQESYDNLLVIASTSTANSIGLYHMSVYSRELTADEVRQNYNALRTRFGK